MKTFRNIFFTALLIATFLAVITQGDICGAEQLLRLAGLFAAGYLWATNTTWAIKLFNK